LYTIVIWNKKPKNVWVLHIRTNIFLRSVTLTKNKKSHAQSSDCVLIFEKKLWNSTDI
jgi:hypothetical protein